MHIKEIKAIPCGIATVSLSYEDIRTITYALDEYNKKEKEKDQSSEELQTESCKLWLHFARLQILCKEGSLDFETEGLAGKFFPAIDIGVPSKSEKG